MAHPAIAGSFCLDTALAMLQLCSATDIYTEAMRSTILTDDLKKYSTKVIFACVKPCLQTSKLTLQPVRPLLDGRMQYARELLNQVRHAVLQNHACQTITMRLHAPQHC
jgi:hypothetical protein